MCGICGILRLDNRPVDPDLVSDMLQMIRHRGPDESGIYLDRAVGLGHARLSILDLSGGAQPMCSADRCRYITFNGEIYNYIELREELLRKGHRFFTNSDTEVLLRLYEEAGEECVDRLNGQWAFAIWDQRDQKLFLSRDRMGVRPVFYCEAAGSFLFASEIKALFAHPDVNREIDTLGLREIFTMWHTIPPRTMFRGISELPPGHCLSVQRGQVRSWSYWHPEYAARAETRDTTLTEEASAEGLGKLLTDAVRLRLRADVPVGAYLSGGLDSSVITALIRTCTDTPLETFSVVFDDPEYDESAHQRLMAERLRTTHHAVRCTYEELSEAFPEVVWHTEKALLRTAPVPMYLLAKRVREHGIKVVLTGEGSDEILGGYDIFKETKIRSFWAVQPDSRLRPLLLRKLYPYLPQIRTQPTEYLKIFFHVSSADLLNPFFSHLPRWEMTRQLEHLFSADVTATWNTQPVWHGLEARLPSSYARWGNFKRAQYLETAYLLPGYILSSQGDRVAMAHAVEGRFPFLDPRVVDFAAKLPANVMMRGLREKHLLKEFAKSLLPASVVRRAKQPYRSPDISTFFGEGRERFRHEYAADLLSPERLRHHGVFHCDAVQNLLRRLRTQPARTSARDSMALTGILSTQLLLHHFIDHFDLRRSHGRAATGAAVLHSGEFSLR